VLAPVVSSGPPPAAAATNVLPPGAALASGALARPPAAPASVAASTAPASSLAAPGTDPQAPTPAPPTLSASSTGSSPAPTRFEPTRACPSHVVAVGPDGIGSCVTTTPAQQKLVDAALNHFGGLDAVLKTLGLPFTGVDIEGIIVVAALAVGAGFALRGRSARRRALLFTEQL
jgi:hypothetical protein